jgi:hypothetical protein
MNGVRRISELCDVFTSFHFENVVQSGSGESWRS